jgi:hypothetical protein
LGQKERGFFVGERTFGYRSVPVGEMRLDKKGRPRSDGYCMEIDPAEAEVVRRGFREFADGRSRASSSSSTKTAFAGSFARRRNGRRPR